MALFPHWPLKESLLTYIFFSHFVSNPQPGDRHFRHPELAATAYGGLCRILSVSICFLVFYLLWCHGRVRVACMRGDFLFGLRRRLG